MDLTVFGNKKKDGKTRLVIPQGAYKRQGHGKYIKENETQNHRLIDML